MVAAECGVPHSAVTLVVGRHILHEPSWTVLAHLQEVVGVVIGAHDRGPVLDLLASGYCLRSLPESFGQFAAVLTVDLG